MLLKEMYIMLLYDNIIISNDMQINWCKEKLMLELMLVLEC